MSRLSADMTSGRSGGIESLIRRFPRSRVLISLTILFSPAMLAAWLPLGLSRDRLTSAGLLCWAYLGYCYYGRRMSLNWDRTIEDYLATGLSVGLETTEEHPPWWREDSRTPFLGRRAVPILLVVSLVAVPFAFQPSGPDAAHGRPQPTTGLLLWLASYALALSQLMTARIARREAFRKRVRKLIGHENTTQASLRRKMAELDQRNQDLERKLDEPTAWSSEHSAEAERRQLHAEVALLRREVLAMRAEVGPSARRRELWMGIGGVVAGFVLAIVGHQFGLT